MQGCWNVLSSSRVRCQVSVAVSFRSFLGAILAAGALLVAGRAQPVAGAGVLGLFGSREARAGLSALRARQTWRSSRARSTSADDAMAEVLAAVRNENETARHRVRRERATRRCEQARLRRRRSSRRWTPRTSRRRSRPPWRRPSPTVETLLPGVTETRAADVGGRPVAQERSSSRRRRTLRSRLGSRRGVLQGSPARQAPIRCRVYATQYDGFTRYEVALPHQRLKFEGGRRVSCGASTDRAPGEAPVKEVGPWNTRDNYWQPERDAHMWRRLPAARPRPRRPTSATSTGAGTSSGRKVLNPAGVDMTPAVAPRGCGHQEVSRAPGVYVRCPLR